MERTEPQPNVPADSNGYDTIYLVMMPPGTTPPQNTCGANGQSDHNVAYVAFSKLDSMTMVATHEIVEAITDPAGKGWRMDRSLNDDGYELADACNGLGDYINGVLVTSYWSNNDDSCMIPFPSCGSEGQACCSAGSSCGPNSPFGSTYSNIVPCSSSTDVCSYGTCQACGATGEPCCAGNKCSVAGDTCVFANNPVSTQGNCGKPNVLVASPSTLSVPQGDGSNSLNTVSTTFNASGFWTGSGAFSVAHGTLPQGVYWNDQNFPTVVLSADMTAGVGQHTIPVTGYAGGYSVSLNLILNVTKCPGYTCDDNGWVCGSFDNGCGVTTTCGNCTPGDYCVAGHCSICNETTCPPLEVWYPAPKCACGPCPCGNVKVGGKLVCKVCG